MRIVGLIAEYNPFHNGHQYHIEKAKEMTHADAVVVVMSGNYVQRGTPAILPKHLRTESALKAGADLVIELPVCYATGTAEQFAYGAVFLLDKLRCVDFLCFGSECGDILSLQELAKILCEEPAAYKEALQEYLRLGLSFPAARQKAITSVFPNKKFAQLLEQPNNILGIEYLKALYSLKSHIEPFTLLRQDDGYHSTTLENKLSSASAIRHYLEEKSDISLLANYIPDFCYSQLNNIFGNRCPVFANDFSLLLKYRLLNETKTSLAEYADVSEELANRIYNQRNQYIYFEQFCELLKTKEITYSRISRALLHILLQIKKSDYTEISYAHILGFCQKKTTILTEIKKYTSIPLLTKLTVTDALSDDAKNMLDMDIYASNLYESVITNKFQTSFKNEYEHPVVRI